MTFEAWVILVSLAHFGAYCLAAWIIGRRQDHQRTTTPSTARRVGYQPGRWWRQ